MDHPVRLLTATIRAMARVVLLDTVRLIRSWNSTGERIDQANSTTQAILQNPLFFADFYGSKYGLVLNDADLYLHYCHVGRFIGYDPNPYFSTSWYLDKYSDVRKIKINPLDHYLQCGALEGRDPGPGFSSWIYWLIYPDVKASGMNPLLHYLLHGQVEGRKPPTLESLSNKSAGAPIPSSQIVTNIDPPFPFAATARSPIVRPADESSPPQPNDLPGPSPEIPAGRRARLSRSICSKSRPDDPSAMRVIERRCPTRVRWFAKLFAADLASFFDGVRLLGSLPAKVDGPLVILTNHPSWWDAELYHWLAVTGFEGRRGFAPMEANNLERYPILTRLGAFPTHPGRGFAGASAFLNTAERLLKEPDAALFIAAEGCFRDQRARPVRVLPGMAHLARRVPEATFVPLAFDYVFWKDRRPNALLHFGQPMAGSTFEGASAGEIVRRMSVCLETTMSALAEAGMSRQSLRFTTLLEKREASRVVHERWRGIVKLVKKNRGIRLPVNPDGTLPQ